MRKTTRSLLIQLGCFTLAILLAGKAPAETSPTSPAIEPTTQPASPQTPGSFTGIIRFELHYLLFLPKGYADEPSKKWPLIVFLHGSGERGYDLNMLKRNGLPKILEHKPDFPFVVLSPQCPPDTGFHVPELNLLLSNILSQYRIDNDRVYLTGLSMGGFATWDWASQSPDRFAAIAPMCGGGNTSLARRLKNLPIWVFHGEADPVVPIRRSQEMVDALTQLGADIRFTHYPGVGHDCWTQSYANPELYTWFLSHHRGEKRTPTTQTATP